MDAASVSAVFAAIAATASWATIFQNRRERRAGAKPDLNVRVLMAAQDPLLVDPNAAVVLVMVDNVGGVAASGVNFIITVRGEVDYGAVSNGFLLPGQSDGPITTGIYTHAPLPPDETHIFVTCRDRLGALHAFTHTMKSKSYRAGLVGGVKKPSKQVIMADLYPGHVLRGHKDVNTGMPITDEGLD